MVGLWMWISVGWRSGPEGWRAWCKARRSGPARGMWWDRSNLGRCGDHRSCRHQFLSYGIDQGLRQGSARAAHVQILDFNRRAEDSHVVHDKSFAMDRVSG